MKKVVRKALLFTIILALFTTPAFAASKSKKAKAAYAKMIKNGSISIGSSTYSAVSDANKDGYPELILADNSANVLKIYTYAKGEVKLIVTHKCEVWAVVYDASRKVFNIGGDSDTIFWGEYKLKKQSFVYNCLYTWKRSRDYKSGKYVKIKNGKETEISKSSFMKKANAKNALKKRSKKSLIKYLKK